MTQKQSQSQSSEPAPKEGEGPTTKELLHAQHNDPNKNTAIYAPPVPPAIESLTPDEAVLGTENFVLYVIGTGFTAASVIHFAGYDEPTTLNPDGSLSTGVNMAVWAGPDTVKVSVHDGGVSSNEVDFTFLTAEPEGATRSKRRR